MSRGYPASRANTPLFPPPNTASGLAVLRHPPPPPPTSLRHHHRWVLNKLLYLSPWEILYKLHVNILGVCMD